MVEFIFHKIKAADQRLDRAVTRIERDESAFNFGQLGNFPAAFGHFDNANQGARANANIGSGFLRKTRLSGLKSFTRNFD